MKICKETIQIPAFFVDYDVGRNLVDLVNQGNRGLEINIGSFSKSCLPSGFDKDLLINMLWQVFNDYLIFCHGGWKASTQVLTYFDICTQGMVIVVLIATCISCFVHWRRRQRLLLPFDS